MYVPTKAIVISKLRYRDNDIIVRCYTEQFGLQSYLLKGLLKRKKGPLRIAYFQELSQLSLIVNYSPKRDLQYLKEAQPINMYQSIHNHITKSAIALFLSEVLQSLLKEETPNANLYSYLETAFTWLDEHDNVINFHLLFLLKLSRHLGFYPDLQHSDYPYFHLKEAIFVNKNPDMYCISEQNLTLFKMLLGINFDDITTAQFNAKSRQTLLNLLWRYFEIHLGNIKQPKSLAILNQVFHA
jgi:DNA repair protein RecO (recombination protein O)